MMAPKEKRIVADAHVIVGHTGAPSDTLAPGEYVVFDPEARSHKEIERVVAAGQGRGLRIEEVDLDAERKSQEAHEALVSELEDSSPAGGQFNPEEHNVADVLAHLKDASEEEVARVKELEAKSDRKSTQVADFEFKGEDEGQ